MPKLAATLASLLLMAISIGVNIVRYPQVGREIDPASGRGPGDIPSSRRTARQPQADAPDKEESPTVDSQADMSGEAESGSSADRQLRAIPRADAVVPIVDVRPMLPVAALATDAAASSAGGFKEVRRLPPVGQGETAVVDSQPVENTMVGFAAYPATATP